jgi:hypothetical protein
MSKLQEQLIVAVKARDGAQAALDESAKALASAKKQIEQILYALTHPDEYERKNPLLAAAERAAEARGAGRPQEEEETADERQRGPTRKVTSGELGVARKTESEKRQERREKQRERERAAKPPGSELEKLGIGGPAKAEPAADVKIDPMAAETFHFEVFGPAGNRLGTQIARNRSDAGRLAAEGWKVPVQIKGQPLPHGPHCGCGTEPEPIPPKAVSTTPRRSEPILSAANQRPTAKPGPIGPMNQDHALRAACELLPQLVIESQRRPMADDEIEKALKGWKAERKSYDHGQGNPWAVDGAGLRGPRYWYDTAAMDDFPVRQHGWPATLEGAELIAAVRRVLHIRRPRPSRADQAAIKSSRKPAAARS